jgi:hypothetical protein
MGIGKDLSPALKPMIGRKTGKDQGEENPKGPDPMPIVDGRGEQREDVFQRRKPSTL